MPYLTAYCYFSKRRTDTVVDEKEAAERRAAEEQLFRAAESGDLETVQKLIMPLMAEDGTTTGEPAVNISARSFDNFTALHFAARSGHTAVVQALIDSYQPMDINCRTKSSWSPLMCAADRGHMDVVALLVKFGAAIHITNSDGKSAIFLARESGHADIAQLLTETSSTRHRRHHRHQHGDTAERSLNHEFFRAAEAGDIDKVKHLLSLSQQQEAATTKKKSRSGDPVQAQEHAPRYYVDINGRGIDNWSALHFAARKGRDAIVSILLQQDPPADINALTKNGWTAMMLACDKGHTDVVRQLLQHGADSRIKSNDGYTAISVAAENQFMDIVQLISAHQQQHSQQPS